MTNANATNITRSESIAVDVITAKGAMLRHAGFWAAVCPLVERAYRHGNDREQWTGKGSSARPLRTCWLAAFNPTDSGKLPATAGARAFRALAAFVSEQQTVKGRDTSAEGIETFLAAAETIVAGIIAPTRAEKPASPTNDADKAKKAIDGAITLLNKAMADHLLTEEQIAAIAAIAASKTSTASTASKATSKAEAMPA